MSMNFKLKDNMLLGAATSATQVEGGRLNHNWNDWYDQGRIKDNSDPSRANDHYYRFKEDISIMKKMGLQIYRLGIEWARIEPVEGKVDKEALAHYRTLLTLLIDAGIEPLLTIHHFTNPMWFENKGGFTKKENIPIFLRYVKKVTESYGDLVSEYITINEPNVYATNSFFFGEWPPGKKSFFSATKVMSILSTIHILAYEMIHTIRKEKGYEMKGKETKVSFANHLRVFEPKNKLNPWHNICAKLSKRFFQSAITEAMCSGKFKWPLRKYSEVTKGSYCDFIGINYYSRSTVTGLGDGIRENVPVNDLGWEIYPEGIVECAREHYKLIKKPIYITENGTCDNKDNFRNRFIYDHLKVLCVSDLPIERYYHWSYIDNFEWLEGESARFGLVHCNYKTQVRTIKDSGYFYSDIIQEQGVTEEMYQRYVEEQNYTIK